MVERRLTIKFIGQDQGLAALASKGSNAIEGLGNAAQQSEGSLTALGIAIKTKLADIGIEAFNQLVQSLNGFLTSTLEVGGAAEQANVAFTTILGSAEVAQQVLGDLSDFAATTPFDLPGIRQAGQQLLAFGFAQEELIPTLTAIGDLAAGTNQSFDELAEIYGKVRTQGRLFAEDLNQFTGRGIPLVAALAEQFNVAESEVRNLVSEGKIGFPELEQAFFDLTAQGAQFGGLMEAQSQTIPGQISNIQDSFVRLQESIFNAFSPAIAGGLETFSQILQEAGERSSGLDEIASASERLATALANPEIIDTLADGLARLVDVSVDQIAGILDAITLFISNAENIDSLSEPFEDLAAALNVLGGTARFLIALAESINSVVTQAKELPIIGRDIESAFSPAGPAIGIFSGRLDQLREVIVRLRSEIDALQNGLDEIEGLRIRATQSATDALASASAIFFDASQRLGESAAQGLNEASEDTQTLKEQFEELEASTEAALDAANQAETQRVSQLRRAQQQEIAALRQQLQAGQVSVEQFEERKAAIAEKFNNDQRQATIDRIRDEIAAEQDRIAQLEQIGGEDAEEKIRESKRKTAELTDDLLAEEVAAEEEAADQIFDLIQEQLDAEERAAEAAKDAAIAAIEERLQVQQNAFEEEIQSVSRLQSALDAVNNSYERQASLLSAQSSLNSTLVAAQQNAFDIAEELADTEEERRRLEREADQARLASLDRTQALELRSFDLRQRQLQIENQIEQARIRGAIAENQAAQAAAQANIETLREEGASEGQIRAAQLQLGASRQQGEALNQQFAATLDQLELIQQQARLGRNELITQQGDQRLQTRFENFQNAQARVEEGGSARDRRSVDRLGEQLEAEANRSIRFLGQGIRENFEEAISELNFQDSLREGLQALRDSSSQALNQLVSRPSLANQPITQAIPAAASQITPQAIQQILAQQPPTAITQENNVTINVTSTEATDGTLANNIEDQVFSALDRVVQRASRVS